MACPKTGFTTQGSFRSHAHTYVRPMRTKEARDESALTLSLGELHTFGQVATLKGVHGQTTWMASANCFVREVLIQSAWLRC